MHRLHRIVKTYVTRVIVLTQFISGAMLRESDLVLTFFDTACFGGFYIIITRALRVYRIARANQIYIINIVLKSKKSENEVI